MGPPDPLSSRQARLSCSSFATHSASSDHRKAPHRKENQFVHRNGSKFHAYDRDKVPYPNSFDRDVMDLESIGYTMLLASNNSPSFTYFDDGKAPKRCLDIGTGMGVWVVASAKLWQETTFVGLDMVNVQIPHRVLDPEIADRIQWVYSNILRNKLPFDDEEFDHVHIQRIALGIPENKWYPLYEEIRRVMKPGATIEQVEEDAIFPILPRWYTDLLRAHSRGLASLIPGSVQHRLSFPHVPKPSHLTHEHELLETLYANVWSSRFINATPTSVLPGYFGAFFERVLSAPVVQFPVPPFVPFSPIKPSTALILGIPAGLKDSLSFRPPLSSNDSSSYSHYANGLETSDSSSDDHPSAHPRPDVPTDGSLSPSPSSTLHTLAENPAKSSLSPSASVASFTQEPATIVPMYRRDSEVASTISTTSQAISSSSGSGSLKLGRRPSQAEGAVMGGERARDVLVLKGIDKISEDFEETTMVMHLKHTVTWVLSAKEAMWDELLVRVLQRDESLKRYGWQDEDYNEQASRARFDYAIGQYKSDMHTRISLWHCAMDIGWEVPSRDPLNKAEVLEEMQLRREITEAQRLAALNEEAERPCRQLRVLTGAKELTA